MPAGSAQPWPGGMKVPLRWPRAPPTPYLQHKADEVKASRDLQDSSETQSPQARAQKEGRGRRGRGRAGNLPHPDSIRAPPVSRPVAPQSASYQDVVASPGRKESSAGEGREGRRVGGAGPGPGRSSRSGQVPGPEPRGQTRPRRASAGTRGCECAMRARRGGCVSPLSPSFPAGPPDRLSRERPPKPQPLRAAPQPGALWPRRVRGRGLRAGGRGAERPRARARVPVQRARRGDRAGCAAAAAAPGGCKPRPPAAQALPLFSPPPRSIPARPAGKADGFAAEAAGASAAVGLGVRVDARGQGAPSRRRVPKTESGAGAGPSIWPVPLGLQG